ncbi:hypothetical protein G6O69_34460 [Pseudenhygromyxa sp. WMMC2535]|uniref:hypothetical protein n=1 Tax=Pseudenhygromyxa sp. WMMC2535 TaxID=2712867 RepID=UPI0015572819|nr:hypothetical protein [Pseudenhygromyxa sp. WMMC2535]NVB42976.1 hypothetical protein [Pseudenhygromyxa sp. WMMC2535]
MQRIFLSYGFADQDGDLYKAALALIDSLGFDVVTGEVLSGSLTEEIKQRIKGCWGLVALMTPREEQAPGVWRTYNWVRDEYNFAYALDMPSVAVIQAGVEIKGSLAGGPVYIEYDPERPLPGVTRLTKLLALWKRKAGRRSRALLLPRDLAQKARGGGASCRYRCFSNRDYCYSDWRDALLVFEPGGVVAHLDAIGEDQLVEVQLKLTSETWASVATPQDLRVELARVGGEP